MYILIQYVTLVVQMIGANMHILLHCVVTITQISKFANFLHGETSSGVLEYGNTQTGVDTEEHKVPPTPIIEKR